MQPLPLPPMVKLFSAGVAFGGFWTPPEDYVPSGIGPAFRLGLVIPDSPLELEFTAQLASGELRRVPYPESTSLNHVVVFDDLVDGYRMDVAVGGGLGWRHVALEPVTIDGRLVSESLQIDSNPAIDALISADAQWRVWVVGPIHFRADVSAFLSVGGEPRDTGTHAWPILSASAGLDLRWEPPPDRDRDGVPDKEDRCPESLEDVDFYDDADGCLDPDDDRDSIPDVEDECKGAAEDVDGFLDADGCPDHNNDRDAYPDSMDQCPNESESENGWIDGDGCPDTLPEDLAAGLGPRRDIVFVGTQLDPASEPALLSLQALLVRYPDISLAVRAYWDGDKGATIARDITLEQCKSLHAWFVAHGVDTHRLDFHWGGDNLPLNADKTEAEHLENRRIDIGLVDTVGSDGKKIEFNPLPMEQWR